MSKQSFNNTPFFAVATVLPLLLLAGCGNPPDPEDYGGGEKGELIAKCVARAERKSSEITREQAGEMCTCMTESVTRMAKSAMSGSKVARSSMSNAGVRCAKKAGITVD